MISSFRLRLTAWYAGLFTILFVVFGLFLYGVLSRALQASLDETLASQAQTAASLFLDEMDEMHGDVAKAANEAVAEMRLRESVVAIFGGGRLLAAGAPVPQPIFEGFVAALPASGGDGSFAMPQYGPEGARAAIHRVGRDYLVIAAEPRDSIAASLRVVRRVLLFGLPLLMFVAGAGGYILAGRSLAPLGWMAEQARRITDRSLNRRLEIGRASHELATLADSFNELLSRLDASFETMRRFVADASHELRTPLSVIRGEAEVALSQERTAGDYRESLAIIHDESRRLSRLVEDLLNLARADAGHVQLRVEEFYLNDLLSEACRAAAIQACSRGVRLECEPGCDVPFRGDETLLRRLVANLLDNAVRYTPPGGTVFVSLDAEGPAARIRVADTGVGIDADNAPHVFERFYRVDKARSREDGGFGLGLSIVKWIAESHRGAVEVASRPEQGTVFTVTLPR